MNDLKTTLMNRDDMTSQEADARIAEARHDFHKLLEDPDAFSDAEDFMMDEFGLEPDYLLDLLETF